MFEEQGKKDKFTDRGRPSRGRPTPIQGVSTAAFFLQKQTVKSPIKVQNPPQPILVLLVFIAKVTFRRRKRAHGRFHARENETKLVSA